MIEVKIAIPQEQAQVLSARALAEGYADIAEYVRSLIAQHVVDEEEVVPSAAVLAALAEGDRSGFSSRTPREVLEELLQRPL